MSGADILNGSFEIFDENDPNLFEQSWETTNSVRCVSSFGTADVSFEYSQASQVEWDLDPAQAVHGDYFAVLSTGDTGSDDGDSIMAEIRQKITFQPGEVIGGVYYFATADYYGWNDYAKITLNPASRERETDLSTIEIEFENGKTEMDVETVGDFRSMENWSTFEYEFTEQTAGEYYLTCGVYDRNDRIYKSYLMLDNFYAGLPQRLRIKNYLEISGSQIVSRKIDISRKDDRYPNAKDGYDLSDKCLSDTTEEAVIYSDVTYYNDPNDPNSLSLDVRSEDSTAPYYLKLSSYGNFREQTSNNLIFTFQGEAPAFGGSSILFQQTSSRGTPEDPNGLNEFYPLYDVRAAIEGNEGVIPLKDLPPGEYRHSEPYGSGVLYIGNRILADFNESSKADMEDFSILARNWMNHQIPAGYKNLTANISGANGIPDYEEEKAKIDLCDLKALSSDWTKECRKIEE
ncbi:hypothetical protein [Sedimentisphaera cyanobacteriorum]|uniref:hypothetical protein n=1 Tax=Sedimentisphaera cyanobacteriorum TaxID=1940790 RepID=UPI0009853F0C|nr:hypothetical protein [Sedimentisphaera cyanobacteriorum]